MGISFLVRGTGFLQKSGYPGFMDDISPSHKNKVFLNKIKEFPVVKQFIVLFVAAVFIPQARAQLFPTTLICHSDCSTERKAPMADDLGSCSGSGSFEINLEKDGHFENGIWQSKSGWDGDQYLSQTFDFAAIDALKNGKKNVSGIQQEGFNHGLNYVSDYKIGCTVKN